MSLSVVTEETRRKLQERPQQPVVMWQEWRHLLFLHWAVEAQTLQALLPDELTVDTYEGNAYVGLVPFTMRNVRPVFAPRVRGLSDFHETNVRTYVHCNGVPGVYFFSLDAANAVAVEIARAVWRLPYFYAEMSLRGDKDGLVYRSRRLWPEPVPAESHVRAVPTGRAKWAESGTREFFLAERYLLFSHDGKRLYSGRVHHAPYLLQRAEVTYLNESLVASAGISLPTGMLPLVHYAAGVEVAVFPLKPHERPVMTL